MTSTDNTNIMNLNETKELTQNMNIHPTTDNKNGYDDCKNSLTLICKTNNDSQCDQSTETYTKGCSWSPDGTCLLVPYADFRIRIYELPYDLYPEKTPPPLPLSSSLTPALTIKEGGLVYDTCWYPWMNSSEPITCCFLTTSKESPVHLWDAFTGELRATYRAYNQVDEVDAAKSVQFTTDGSTIWTGFKGILRSFDLNRPGRQNSDIILKNEFPKMHGIVSCIRDHPVMGGLLAIGTYSKFIGLYKDGPLCLFETSSGVSQIEFSSCGTKLYSTARRSNEFICWDLRNPGKILYSLDGREADTNQRVQFSLSQNQKKIISGGTDGFLKVWETLESTNQVILPSWSTKVSDDCVNGVNIHKTLPIIATSSGQRVYDEEAVRDNNVYLWHFSGLLD